MRPRPAVDGADAHEVRDFDPPDASVDFKPRGMGEVITIKEAVDRIAFQTCHLSSQDHVSQPAEELIRRAVLQSVRMRGTAKGAQQLSHFYATVITSLAEKLNESELLCDTWFNKWKDDVAR
tara:strand:+ start:34323 stop:34688 length:366 start_codon:yes stop_codon:yes gene_type:complete